MARLIWTEPALGDLDTIADYIALDKPAAARQLVQKVFRAVERLGAFPKSGRVVPEIPDLPYRELIVPPFGVFYRAGRHTVFIIHVMRAEQDFRRATLEDGSV